MLVLHEAEDKPSSKKSSVLSTRSSLSVLLHTRGKHSTTLFRLKVGTPEHEKEICDSKKKAIGEMLLVVMYFGL